MQSNALAARAYSQNTRSVGTPRAVEYQAFTRVTALLRSAAKPETSAQDRIQAVLQNNKLWALLAADLLSENNALSQELRGQLLSLAEFARKQGLKAMSGEAEIEPLIDINLTIMRGLRGEEAGAAAPSGAKTVPVAQAGGSASTPAAPL